ncbi:MAG: hypothetical protein WCS52_19080 [bacterium]
MKILGQWFLAGGVPAVSGVFENENAGIAKGDPGGLPCGALVEPFGVGHTN